MTRDQMEEYLRLLGLELHKKGLELELILLGEAALLIEGVHQQEIEQIDTYFFDDYEAMVPAIVAVESKEGLAGGWLSSFAAAFTFMFKKVPVKHEWKTFPGLRVYTASLEYIFVMEMMSNHSKNPAYCRELLKRLEYLRPAEVKHLLMSYVPAEQITPDLNEEIDELFD